MRMGLSMGLRMGLSHLVYDVSLIKAKRSQAAVKSISWREVETCTRCNIRKLTLHLTAGAEKVG